MKKQFVLLFVSTIHWMYVANATAEDLRKPLLVLMERNPWLLVGGSDSPKFALYDNKEIIFRNPRCSLYFPYLHVTLSDDEFQNLLTYIDLSEEFSTLKTFYILSDFTDDVTQEFYVHLDAIPKKVVVYGSLRKPELPKDIEAVAGEVYQELRTSCGSQQKITPVLRKVVIDEKTQKTVPLKTVVVCGVEVEFLKAIVAARYMRDVERYHSIRKQCPKELTFLFDTFIDYFHPRAEAWLPENIEVMIWSSDVTKHVTDWPAEWPDLHDSATRKRGGNEYSLFLDSDEWVTFKDFLVNLRGAVRINGRTWSISYRFPFPREEVWEKNGWRDLRRNSSDEN